jgi:hypothetical protein
MKQLLDDLKLAKVIVDYDMAPPRQDDAAARLTLWVGPAVTEMTLTELLQAVVDRSVETGSSWDVRIGIAVERARISPEGIHAGFFGDQPR